MEHPIDTLPAVRFVLLVNQAHMNRDFTIDDGLAAAGIDYEPPLLTVDRHGNKELTPDALSNMDGLDDVVISGSQASRVRDTDRRRSGALAGGRGRFLDVAKGVAKTYDAISRSARRAAQLRIVPQSNGEDKADCGQQRDKAAAPRKNPLLGRLHDLFSDRIP